jgi:hypothetical protein
MFMLSLRLSLPVSIGHGVFRLMGISCKIYDIRRRYGGITEPGARSALLSHAHKCNTSLETMLAAYNNSSEVELNECDRFTGGVTNPDWLGAYPYDTKVAKLFDGVWCEGVVKRYDAEEDFYWILYTDGDSEEFDAEEVRQGLEDHKLHMQAAAAESSDEGTAAPEDSMAENTVVVSQAVTPGEASFTGMSAAIAALAKATEQLAAFAERLTAQQQQQQAMVLQQQQQAMILQRQQQHQHQQRHMHLMTQQLTSLRQQQQLQQQQRQAMLLRHQQGWYW